MSQSRMGLSAPSLTRSLRSFPGLKCGTYFPDKATASPVLGLRPCRGGLKCRQKLPNPRISIRSPVDRESLMISRICFSASSTSFEGRCFCFAVMISMSSDFVMFEIMVRSIQGPPRRGGPRMRDSTASAAIPDVLLQEVPQAGARRRRLRGAVALHRFRLLVRFLRLDRERDGARLAVDARELRLDLIPDLQHRARILHAVAAELRGTQLTLDTVAE